MKCYYAGSGSSFGRTLAALDVKFVANIGANGAYRIEKIIKLYAGGVGMLEGMHIFRSETERTLFEYYIDARQKMIQDCKKKIAIHQEAIEIEQRWIEDFVEMDE
jgi:hypothetical protein